MSNFTPTSCNDFPALFKLMFPDSEVVSKVLLGTTKLGYVVNYGLAPYFRGKVFDTFKQNVFLLLQNLISALMSLLTELATESN